MGTMVDAMSNPDPSNLPGFLAWLMVDSAGSVALAAALIWLYQRWKGREMSDTLKKATAFASPIVVILVAYHGQCLFGYEAWDPERLFQYLYVAVAGAFGGQGVFHFVWNPVGQWFEKMLKPKGV